MIFVKDENYQERTAAIGDWWESTENPSCILPRWAPSPGPPETVVGTGSSQHSLPLDSLCLRSPSISLL